MVITWHSLVCQLCATAKDGINDCNPRGNESALVSYSLPC